ncbi:uncharacterized protein LOC112460598 [Temnothorax curvispinosus]|uniref:Uncharacterized protein LOC112460598 n=1 Tax=Temnothorax curvispinosus TaxID=300111 RepID=A0A6J1QH19_9HYME|nr:uncharacterized protein LOC112460598 [Temnothorax curvispinosus]
MSSSSEKRKILSSTDQDSAEKKIRIEKQVSEEEVQDISDSETIPEKEQTTIFSSFLPSYIKSCSQTQIKSTILDHTWKIDQFLRFSKITNTIKSPSFPETAGQHMIQMSVLRHPGTTGVVNFYIRTNKAFNGSCTTTVMYPPETALSSNSILGRISDMTLLIGISTAEFQFNSTDTLIIHCKFECFHKMGNNTIHMHLLPSSTVLKDMKSHDDSTHEFKSRESIKFLVGGEQYVVSRELLYATNSSYFKNMCLTHEGIEKDMTKELVSDNEVESFKHILLYIITGSVDQCDYDMLKKLLTTANKYDVPDLKLTCEHYLLRYITIKNALELVQLAFLCNAKFLETHSANFIQIHIKEVMNTKNNET